MLALLNRQFVACKFCDRRLISPNVGHTNANESFINANTPLPKTKSAEMLSATGSHGGATVQNWEENIKFH